MYSISKLIQYTKQPEKVAFFFVSGYMINKNNSQIKNYFNLLLFTYLSLHVIINYKLNITYSLGGYTMKTSTIDPFLMNELEFHNWMTEQNKKHNEINSLLSHLKFIPSLWKSENNTFIISKSAKKENKLQLTCFDKNNIPVYDLIRSLDNINDIVEEIVINDCTIQQINYIN
jgi:hypothetical protein